MKTHAEDVFDDSAALLPQLEDEDFCTEMQKLVEIAEKGPPATEALQFGLCVELQSLSTRLIPGSDWVNWCRKGKVLAARALAQLMQASVNPNGTATLRAQSQATFIKSLKSHLYYAVESDQRAVLERDVELLKARIGALTLPAPK